MVTQQHEKTTSDAIKRMTLSLPVDLHRELSEQARAEHRSLHGQILYLLEQSIHQRKEVASKAG